MPYIDSVTMLCAKRFFIVGENNLAVPDVQSVNMGSRASCRDITLMENILDWQSIIKKYYAVVKTPIKPN